MGMAQCYKRFRVKDEKVAQEKQLRSWIGGGSTRSDRWGNLLEDLDGAYSKTAAVERDKVIFRETILQGTVIGTYLLRAWNSKDVKRAKEVTRLTSSRSICAAIS